jgi:hypothetical protein
LVIVATPHSHNFRCFIRVAPTLVKAPKMVVTVVTKSAVPMFIFERIFYVLIAPLCTLETDDTTSVAAHGRGHAQDRKLDSNLSLRYNGILPTRHRFSTRIRSGSPCQSEHFNPTVTAA